MSEVYCEGLEKIKRLWLRAFYPASDLAGEACAGASPPLR